MIAIDVKIGSIESLPINTGFRNCRLARDDDSSLIIATIIILKVWCNRSKGSMHDEAFAFQQDDKQSQSSA
jgi:hypothetical protein